MNKQYTGTVIASIVVGFLTLFLLIGIFVYISDLKTQIAKEHETATSLQAQVTSKDTEISTKAGEIDRLSSEVQSCSGDLDAKRKELDQKLGQVKHLQTSIKTVSGCLVGTVGLLEAFRQENVDMLRKSATIMDGTCKQAGEIIKKIESFTSDTQTTGF